MESTATDGKEPRIWIKERFIRYNKFAGNLYTLLTMPIQDIPSFIIEKKKANSKITLIKANELEHLLSVMEISSTEHKPNFKVNEIESYLGVPGGISSQSGRKSIFYKKSDLLDYLHKSIDIDKSIIFCSFNLKNSNEWIYLHINPHFFNPILYEKEFYITKNKGM